MESNSQKLKKLESEFIASKTKEESDKIFSEIIKLLPNDYDLGSYIRFLQTNIKHHGETDIRN